MKTSISILLNIVLIIIVIYMYVSHVIIDPYYKGYVGMVLNTAAYEIEAGNSKRVQKILSEVPYRPSYNEICSILMKLKNNEIAEQGGAGQPATRPVDEPEGGDKSQPEAEGRSR